MRTTLFSLAAAGLALFTACDLDNGQRPPVRPSEGPGPVAHGSSGQGGSGGGTVRPVPGEGSLASEIFYQEEEGGTFRYLQAERVRGVDASGSAVFGRMTLFLFPSGRYVLHYATCSAPGPASLPCPAGSEESDSTGGLWTADGNLLTLDGLGSGRISGGSFPSLSVRLTEAVSFGSGAGLEVGAPFRLRYQAFSLGFSEVIGAQPVLP